MLKIGVTGGIGSGKSFVCNILEKMGYPVYYSDLESKKIVDTNTEIRKQLTALLGKMVYENNQLNRTFLAQQLFQSSELRTQVNTIIHPVVRFEFNRWTQAQSSEIVFNEAAIFFETGAHTQFDKMILVTAPEELRIERTMNRSNLSRQEVQSRMQAQWADEQKIPLSDFVIENDGRPLLYQIENLLEFLKN